jgi:small-conductance mechanosensitive channel
MKKLLFYISGTLTLIWGIAHLFPTAGIVRDFGDISSDNRLIITMEWIIEGLTLIFLGVLTITITRIETESKLAKSIYVLIMCMLTGFRIDFLPFRLCPIIFSASAILIILGMKSKSKAQNNM